MSKPVSTPTKPAPLPLKTTAAIITADTAIRSLYGSLRKTIVGGEYLAAQQASGKGFILAIFHCNVLLAPIIHRGSAIMVMVSMSHDGDVIAGVVERLGNVPVRGSSSKEGRKALSQMISSLRAGKGAAITPDGPLGPYMKIKAGVVAMAQRTGVPIIPMHYEADRSWHLSSWDRHVVPKPFSRLFVRYGEPIMIPAELSQEQQLSHLVQAERQILANVTACRKLAGQA